MIDVCFVSTFPPARCGIGNYTYNLSRWLIDQHNVRVYVAAEIGAERVANKELVCIPCFKRNNPYSEIIADWVEKFDPDIVHVQHDYSVYSLGNEFFSFVKSLNKKLVVTMHEIHTPSFKYKIDYGLENLVKNHAKLGRMASLIIVHSELMKSWLVGYGIERDKVVVIPHGTAKIPKVGSEEAKLSLGFSRKEKVILSFGFTRSFKEDTLLIEALPEVIKHVPEARLLLVGSLHPFSSREDHERVKRRRELTEKLGLDAYVTIVDRYVDEDEIPLIFGCADVVAYLHNQRFVEVSGALHIAIGAEKPVICTKVPRYEEVWRPCPEAAFEPEDKRGLVSAVTKMLINDKVKKSVLMKIKALAYETGWKRIATMHYELYDSLLSKDN